MQSFPKFGQKPASTPAAAPSTPTTAPARPAPPMQQRQPAPPPTPAAPPARMGFGAGIPPRDPNAGDGGGDFEKRDADYWRAHPLKVGTYYFFAFVSKIVMWADGGVTLTLRVSEWDRDQRRPGEHHGRNISWPQGPGNRSGDALNRWRAEIIKAYQAAGYADETAWPQSSDGAPCPPWHEFWVQQMPDGLYVPCLLGIEVNVPPPREGMGLFTNVKKVARMDGPVQAPMPFELPEQVATLYGWRFGQERHITKDGRHLATTVPIDKDCVPLGHLGLKTYKDI